MSTPRRREWDAARQRRRRLEAGEAAPAELRGRRKQAHPRGQVTGQHLLADPRVPRWFPTSADWTQAERDRAIALGIRPARADQLELDGL